MLSFPPFSSAVSTSSRQVSSEPASRCEHVGDVGVVEHVGQTVAAEQHPVAVGELPSLDVDAHVFLESPQGVGQHVAQPVPCDILLADEPLVGELLGLSLIARQEPKRSGAKKVSPRITDLRHEQVVAQAEGRGHRRSHALQVGLESTFLLQRFMDLLAAIGGTLDHPVCVFIALQPEDPVGSVKNDVHERGDRHPARHLASRVASHPVGNDHHVACLGGLWRDVPRRHIGQQGRDVAPSTGDEVVVLVPLPDPSLVGERRDIDAHVRGGRRRGFQIQKRKGKLIGVDVDHG